MPKGQQRSNREKKKPKQPKKPVAPAAQQMEKHFFGSGADVASGYIPPTQQQK